MDCRTLQDIMPLRNINPIKYNKASCKPLIIDTHIIGKHVRLLWVVSVGRVREIMMQLLVILDFLHMSLSVT